MLSTGESKNGKCHFLTLLFHGLLSSGRQMLINAAWSFCGNGLDLHAHPVCKTLSCSNGQHSWRPAAATKHELKNVNTAGPPLRHSAPTWTCLRFEQIYRYANVFPTLPLIENSVPLIIPYKIPAPSGSIVECPPPCGCRQTTSWRD